MINKSRMNWRLPVVDLLRQSMQETPLVEVENTITLRVLVLALVAVGIMATDIAAETKFSFWAVPLSVVGAIWSYYRRRERNVSVKFCIAIGMLAALGAFFGRLFGELNDTRLALAELLIQLQVLHSFDMPRRKDLGYSIVIGLILLGVAATLSQTLAFAPVLLLFLAIALPTLVLDYRSRLGFQKFVAFSGSTREQQKTSSLLSWKFLFFYFLIIVVAGLYMSNQFSESCKELANISKDLINQKEILSDGRSYLVSLILQMGLKLLRSSDNSLEKKIDQMAKGPIECGKNFLINASLTKNDEDLRDYYIEKAFEKFNDAAGQLNGLLKFEARFYGALSYLF